MAKIDSLADDKEDTAPARTWSFVSSENTSSLTRSANRIACCSYGELQNKLEPR